MAVGRLGVSRFIAGHYIYTGSAMNGLRARLLRHYRLKAENRMHWHIDRLSVWALEKEFAVVRTTCRIECALNRAVSVMPEAVAAAEMFGCSDCRCRTHLHRVHGPVWPDFPGLEPWQDKLLSSF